jgi:hypothetical protein
LKVDTERATRVYVLDDVRKSLDWLNPQTGGLEAVCAKPKCEKLSYGPKMIKYSISNIDPDPASANIELDFFQIDRVKAEIEYAYRDTNLRSGYLRGASFKGTCSPAPLPSSRAPAAKF